MAGRCLPEIDATACSRSDRAPLPPKRITANNIHTWLLIGSSSTPPQTFSTRSRFNRVRNPSRRPPRVASLKQMRRRLVMPVSRYPGQPSRRRHGCATAACLPPDPSSTPNCAHAPHPAPPRREPYVGGGAIGASLHLRAQLRKPLLVEGHAGVGKTEIAKVMARVLDADLIRLQCYEGLDASTALYEWNYPRQLLHI